MPVADPLFAPLQLGPLRLKNRIVMPPMGTGLDADGVMNDAAIAYYRRRAEGGTGTITVEALLVDPETRGPEPRIDDDRYVPWLRRLVDELRPYDVTIGAQLLHPGRQVLAGRLVGPSAISLNSAAPEPHALTIPEIEAIVAQFADGAARAVVAGYDFIEIHAAHGYLPSDFLSPLANRRDDAYGGDLERRARFPREILRAIAERCPGVPVIFRLSADEGLPGGTQVEDAIAVAQWLEADGVACISVSAGHWKALQITLAPMFVPRGHLVALAGRIKRELTVPVIAVGRLDQPDDARAALTRGDADLVAIGRGLIADPDWAQKVEAGRPDQVRPCIACNACVDLVGMGGELRCAVNPAAGRDERWSIEPALVPRRVAVVGSGPAGMEAARIARLRGHDVSLWERASRLGGKLEAAASAPSKREVLLFRDYEVGVLAELGVALHAGVDVTPEVLDAVDPDVVVLATGADVLVPPIPGLEGPAVCDAQALLSGEVSVRPGERVIVIGGSATGCETAELLAAEGAAVTIVEMAPVVGNGIEAITRRHLLRELRAAGVTILTHARVVGFDGDAVRYVHEDVTQSIEADRVALAVGWRPRGGQLADVFGDRQVVVVGDASSPADFVAAVNAGADVGLAI